MGKKSAQCNQLYTSFLCLIFRMASLVRQNYSEECEAAVNRQIHEELSTMYTYMSLVSWLSCCMTGFYLKVARHV